MTDDQLQTVRDDIAFMRALAAEGQHAPMLGGSIIVAAGSIFGLASLIHWMAVNGWVALRGWGYSVLWLGAVAAFLIALILLSRRFGPRPGGMAPVNRASRAAWSAVGTSIFAIGVSIAVITARTGSGAVMALFPSVIFVFYGMAWAVAAAMTGKRWLRLVGLGSWVLAPVLAWLGHDPSQYLVYAGGMLLLMILPGLALMRQEPGETV